MGSRIKPKNKNQRLYSAVEAAYHSRIFRILFLGNQFYSFWRTGRLPLKMSSGPSLAPQVCDTICPLIGRKQGKGGRISCLLDKAPYWVLEAIYILHHSINSKRSFIIIFISPKVSPMTAGTLFYSSIPSIQHSTWYVGVMNKYIPNDRAQRS